MQECEQGQAVLQHVDSGQVSEAWRGKVNLGMGFASAYCGLSVGCLAVSRKFAGHAAALNNTGRKAKRIKGRRIMLMFKLSEKVFKGTKKLSSHVSQWCGCHAGGS
jgi:hypothetical protein